MARFDLAKYYPNLKNSFWEDLVGLDVLVDCKTFQEDFAVQKWGPDFRTRKTKGTIRKVCTKRGKSDPLFEIYFSETKKVYNNLDIEYVLRFLEDVPLKYHEISARYIVEISKAAALNTKFSPEELKEEESKEQADVEPLPKKQKGAKGKRKYLLKPVAFLF